MVGGSPPDKPNDKRGTIMDIDYTRFGPTSPIAPLVLDGAIGTLLGQLGWDLDKDELWGGGAILEAPELVAKVHEQYIKAGAQIIETNTYQIALQTLKDRRGYTQQQADMVLKKAVQIAHDAILASGRPVAMVASVGPYATYLRDASEYTGAYVKVPNFKEQTIIDYYLDQSRPLLDAGVSVLNFETIPSLKEVELVGKVLDQLHREGRQARAWVSCACQDARHTNAGDAFADVVRVANAHPRIVAIGINCTAPEHISGLLAEAAKAGNTKTLVVYPNSGELYNPDTRKFEQCSMSCDHNSIADHAAHWYALGARIFGGCCRVTPAQIAELANACKELSYEKLTRY